MKQLPVPVRETADAPSHGVDLRAWAGVVALVTLLLTSYRHLDHLARGGSGDLLRTFLEESTASLGAGLLFFAVGAFVRRLPLDRDGRWRRLPWYVPALLVFSALHTTSNWLLRELVFRLVGRGDYDYGRMPLRYLMEFPVDLALFVLFCLFFHGLRHVRRARSQELRAARLEAHLASAQVRSLHLQLQPHFLFNALHVISSVMYDEPERADEMIDRLSELLRASLRTSGDDEVALDEELRVLDAYLALLDARFGDRLRVERRVVDGLGDARLPPFLLKPLVENAVRHGAVESGGRGTITLSVASVPGEDGPVLRLVVSDHGPEAAAPAAQRYRGEKREGGTGLGATRERLRILYGHDAGLEAGELPADELPDDAGRGFRVVIRLPLRRDEHRRDVT